MYIFINAAVVETGSGLSLTGKQNKSQKKPLCLCHLLKKPLLTLSLLQSLYFFSLLPSNYQLCNYSFIFNTVNMLVTGKAHLHWLDCSRPDAISTIYIQSVVGYQMC